MLLVGLGYQALTWLPGLLSFAGTWEEELHYQVKSPDGRYIAAVYFGNAGATTSGARSVHPTDSSHPFKKVYQGHVPGAIITLKGLGKGARIRWSNPTHLVVTCPLAEVRHREDSWKDVTISYQNTVGP
jgi:hypothetical protein